MPNDCAEYLRIADTLTAAVAAVYKARREYDSAKKANAGDTSPLQAALTQARQSELAAIRALKDHVDTHRCQALQSGKGT
jgi:hypothetical protein